MARQVIVLVTPPTVWTFPGSQVPHGAGAIDCIHSSP